LSTGIISAGDVNGRLCGKDSGKLLGPCLWMNRENKFYFIFGSRFGCAHFFLKIIAKFSIEGIVIGISDKKAAFCGAEKTTGWLFGIIHEDVTRTGKLDEGGDDELKIEALT
jgi:hypothetical protein